MAHRECLQLTRRAHSVRGREVGPLVLAFEAACGERDLRTRAWSQEQLGSRRREEADGLAGTVLRLLMVNSRCRLSVDKVARHSCTRSRWTVPDCRYGRACPDLGDRPLNGLSSSDAPEKSSHSALRRGDSSVLTVVHSVDITGIALPLLVTCSPQKRNP